MINKKDEYLLQALEESRCLNRRQVENYLQGDLFPEEIRAIELHLADCKLCNFALEGFQQHDDFKILIQELEQPHLPEVKKITVAAASHKKAKDLSDLPKPRKEDNKSNQAESSKQKPKRKTDLIIKSAGAALILSAGAYALWLYEYKTPQNTYYAPQTPSFPSFKKAVDSEKSKGKDDLNNKEIVTASEIQEPIPSTENKINTEADSATKETSTTEEEKTNPPKDDSIDQKNTSQKADSKLKTENTTANNTNKTTEEKKKEATPVEKSSQKTTENKGTENKVSSNSNRPAEAQNPKAEEKVENKNQKNTTASTSNTNQENVSAPSGDDYDIGVSLFKKKQYESALVFLGSVVKDKNNPKYFDALYYSALCNKNLKNKQKAKQQFQQIIKANAPQKTAAQNQLDDLND